MSYLEQILSDKVNLEMQGISLDRKSDAFGKGTRNIAEAIEKILQRRERNPGNPKGETYAEKQDPSVILPLRVLLAQQFGKDRVSEIFEKIVGRDVLMVGLNKENEAKAVKALKGQLDEYYASIEQVSEETFLLAA